MPRGRILIVGVAVAVLIAVLGGAFGGGPGSGGAEAQPGPAGQAVLGRLLEGLSAGDTAAYVERLEKRRARDPQTLVLLGLAYQQRFRETGDPRFLSLSGRALGPARRSPSTNGLATTGLASLAATRHRFSDGLALAREALRADPENASAQGARGDALLNLGRYREAFAAYDRMAALSPSVASYGRVAHARELVGRPAAAREPLELALTLDVTVPEHRAAAYVQLGNIDFNSGRLAAARRAYSRALRALPGYVHAEAGLARTEAASGRLEHAAALFRRVVERLPLPQYATWQGDTLRAAGHAEEARQAYRVVEATGRIQAANGVRTELQTALFDLDQGRRPAAALERARRAYALAPSIDAADVVAWGLLRTGRCREALGYSRSALRLGTRDALKLFHRGMIERCLGRPDAGRRWLRRALAVNPYFSLVWAPVARRHVR